MWGTRNPSAARPRREGGHLFYDREILMTEYTALKIARQMALEKEGPYIKDWIRKRMKKRMFMAGALALAALPTKAEAQEDEAADVTYVVPKGVNSIRVRSFVGDKKVLDTNFKVTPGQRFRINAAEQ